MGGGQSQQDRASQHVTSVILMKKWAQILYPPPPPTATLPCSPTPDGVLPCQPPVGGSCVQEITYATCVQDRQTRFADGHCQNEFQFPLPDKRSLIEVLTPCEPMRDASGSLSQTVQRTYMPGGDRLSYSATSAVRGGAVIATSQGQVEFKGEPPAQFKVTQAFGATMSDAVDMTLGDGSHFTLSVPIQRFRIPAPSGFIGVREPSTGGVIQGAFTAGGRQVRFEVRGAHRVSPTQNEWVVGTDWKFIGPDGVDGAFQLNPDFSGRGQFTRRGQVDSSISWDADGKASITLVTGDATTAGPSAAALAFLLHAWQELIVQGAPAPGG